MHDRPRALLGEDPRQQPGILDVTLIQRHAFGNGETKTRRQIVDDSDGSSGIDERQHRVAADISGAAGDEDGKFALHDRRPSMKHISSQYELPAIAGKNGCIARATHRPNG
jgi:hypothetical protein